MHSNIEASLRNAKQVEVPSSTLDKVDDVLRNLEHRKDIIYMKPKYKRPIVLVAVIVISILMFSTVALAYTGVLSGVFSAITGGRDVEGEFGTETRLAIVAHEHVVETTPTASTISIADSGNILELNAYFADAREIWFDFTLSGEAIPEDKGWEQILPNFFLLEMTQSDGTVDKWEFIVDENSERKTFPGGHGFIDRVNNTHEFVADDDSHVFVFNTVASYAEDGSLDITIIVSFSYPYPTIGEKIHLQIGNLRFHRVDGEFVEGADNSDIIYRTWLNDIWEFEIDVDSRFKDVSELTYSVVNVEEAAQLGITIHSITVTPTATRVEATIDLSKGSVLNPDYAVVHERIYIDGVDGWVLENPTRQEILDMRLMHLEVYAITDARQYRGSTGEARTTETGDTIEGWWEFGSMYFDAPESLTLVFETIVFGGEYTADEIRIPLTLVR